MRLNASWAPTDKLKINLDVDNALDKTYYELVRPPLGRAGCPQLYAAGCVQLPDLASGAPAVRRPAFRRHAIRRAAAAATRCAPAAASILSPTSGPRRSG